MDMNGVEKVKKALSLCGTADFCEDTDCPYKDDKDCTYTMPRDALDAICFLQKQNGYTRPDYSCLDEFLEKTFSTFMDAVKAGLTNDAKESEGET